MKNNNINEVMNIFFNVYKEVVSKNEYINNNRLNVLYGFFGLFGNYIFMFKIIYCEMKE